MTMLLVVFGMKRQLRKALVDEDDERRVFPELLRATYREAISGMTESVSS